MVSTWDEGELTGAPAFVDPLLPAPLPLEEEVFTNVYATNDAAPSARRTKIITNGRPHFLVNVAAVASSSFVTNTLGFRTVILEGLEGGLLEKVRAMVPGLKPSAT